MAVSWSQTWASLELERTPVLREPGAGVHDAVVGDGADAVAGTARAGDVGAGRHGGAGLAALPALGQGLIQPA